MVGPKARLTLRLRLWTSALCSATRSSICLNFSFWAASALWACSSFSCSEATVRCLCFLPRKSTELFTCAKH